MKNKACFSKMIPLLMGCAVVACGPGQNDAPDAGMTPVGAVDMMPDQADMILMDQGGGRADQGVSDAGTLDMPVALPDQAPSPDMSDMGSASPDMSDQGVPDMAIDQGVPDMADQGVMDMAQDQGMPDMPASTPDMSIDMAPDMGTSTPLLLERIAAGDAHTCAIDLQGAAWCWGDGSAGQLGHGALTSSDSPVAVTMPANQTFVEITAGGRHTCALTSGGELYCWGFAGHGQLGDDGNDRSNIDFTRTVSVPVAVVAPAGVTFTEVDAGGLHTCAVSMMGQAYCWGEGRRGALGTGSGSIEVADEPQAVSQPVGVFFADIEAGKEHTCAAGLNPANGTYGTYCWGENMDGRLGTGSSNVIERAPQLVSNFAGGTQFLKPHVGALHTCAHSVGAMQALYLHCWGSNSREQLGNMSTSPGGSTTRPGPITEIPAPDTFVEVALGTETSCGISGGGKVWCWGSDEDGILGNGGSSMDVAVPTRIAQPAGTMLRWITVGGQHACAIDPFTDTAYCWGSDAQGQLGDGAGNVNAQSPVAVVLP